ncbi:hypothetical protein [Leptolyngbya sp. FACHB-1624]|uniref:hypothetical protein n=1 Tax=Leptolyngbya sp. FACHB-1624 TaxID=2692802 RepID=UPI0039EC887E
MKVGNFVYWRTCPGHLSAFQRNQIVEVRGDRARLRFFRDFIAIADLELTNPGEGEQIFCKRYGTPITNDWDDYDDW